MYSTLHFQFLCHFNFTSLLCGVGVTVSGGANFFLLKVDRVATVSEKYLENEIFSRSGKSHGLLWMVREI